MPGSSDPVARIRAHVATELRAHGPAVLAVSGGRDSMVLLDAAMAVARDAVAGVASFDHGTGESAELAVRRVRRAARVAGVPAVVGRAQLRDAGEAAWREARWRFLRAAARRLGAARVATAHTRDDQVETVALRVLRGAGARGLAALLAPAPGICRPLLDVPRADVAAYAEAAGVRWVDDPSNASRAYARNRLRLDVLPALERAAPGLGEALLDVGRRAAAWRADVEALADAAGARRDEAGALHVALDTLGRYDPAGWSVLWPALAARVGVRLDRRGTARLVAFTRSVAAEAVTGARIQLAGGADVVVRRGAIVLRPRALAARAAREPGRVPADACELSVDEVVRFGRFRFRPVGWVDAGDPWGAELPVEGPIVVRAWCAGDRMHGSGAGAARRVKRFFSDARIPGAERAGWPVVEAGGTVLWIPGVRRGHAVTSRPAGPARRFLCELIDD